MGILAGMSSPVGDSWKHDGGPWEQQEQDQQQQQHQRPLNGSVGEKTDQWMTAFTAPLACQALTEITPPHHQRVRELSPTLEAMIRFDRERSHDRLLDLDRNRGTDDTN